MDVIRKTDKKIRILVTAVVCAIFFLLALSFLSQGGLYLLTFFDLYTYEVAFWILCIIECVIVAGIYGLEQFSEDIRMMTSRRPPVVYKFIWTFVLPVFSFDRPLNLQPDSDLRPATDQWMDYEHKQRKMEWSLCGNLKDVFKR